MTGPGPYGGQNPNQPGQAYSQAIPLPPPPRGPAAPNPVPGGAPPPPQKPSSGRNVIVALVAVASVVALIAAIVVAALLSDSNGADPGKDTASATTGAGAVFRINDCLYDVPEAPKVGNCDDGGSPYKVTQVMQPGEKCRAEQTSIARGRWYCLTPNLNVNYCYTAPVPGTWIKAAGQCGAPGTITVVSVVGGLKDSGRCSGEWDRSYFFDDPVYTICAKSYT
ncbi:hypothetical protein HWD35_04900 [Tsukamurella tyrosinosolvens]|uniref:Uncharacterized protein n=1 Tax=Tsukamurella tyrosinosolvens TaxID=57704 RepID=A0A1H4QUG8_TSUTY|nr:hypothetical protein [Tsukamurella tyrosinosolvens]AUN39964.1 hypothetical protein ASU32_08005 [Tsukamurella tyrosinosolvens]KXO91483.1 hypothetical protein AXK58_19985 [Tsukamurella tyrosinosolvens]KXP05416.1 hypothetical protein AXK59_07565 [Tsukamurella tyrosinosolvens]KZL94800.1 hypothetical protein AXX05_18585 [Tsukamurella tyrosinosolvens]MCA4994044.1 hypothetical protein [Tsukamurella tyrosinosolvens]